MVSFRHVLVFLFLFSLFFSAQAVTLNITVRDNADFTPLRDAAIAANGDFVGKSGTDGTFSLSHAFNDSFYLKITKSGYDDWIDIVSPTLTSIIVDMSRKSQMVTISVFDRETLQPLVNALVKVSGENLSVTGATDSEGNTQFNLKINNIYTVEINSPKYEPILKTIEVTSNSQVFQYWLYRNDLFIVKVVDVSTQSPLSNVTVWVDNTSAGSTGGDGRLILYLEREKKYRIDVTLPDYETASLDKYLTNEDLFITIPLAKASYPISIAVFDERKIPVEGASILINGSLQGKTDPYGRLGLSSINAGTYSIEVKKDGYVDWQENKTITKHGEEIISTIPFASIDVTVRTEEGDHTPVTGSGITINGVPVGTTSELGEFKTMLKTSSSYNISVTHDGYRPASKVLDLSLGATPMVVSIVMERELSMTLVMVSLIGLVVIVALILVIRAYWVSRARKPRRH